jgi:surface antigen
MRQRARTFVGSLTVAALIAIVPMASAAAGGYWQCVPFARLMSGIQIFGDAWTWWSQAAGRYETGYTPKSGAVLCFKPVGAMRLGHVAVVSQVLTDRVIQVTHANWSLLNGARGQVEKDVTVVDVSPGANWGQVKVWYDPIRDLGSTVYPTYGFIYPDAQARQLAGTTSKVAMAQNTAVTMAQSAATKVVDAARPGASPLRLLNEAADSTDKIAALIQAATGDDDDK